MSTENIKQWRTDNLRVLCGSASRNVDSSNTQHAALAREALHGSTHHTIHNTQYRKISTERGRLSPTNMSAATAEHTLLRRCAELAEPKATSQFHPGSTILGVVKTRQIHKTNSNSSSRALTVVTGTFLKLKERRCLPSLSSLQSCCRSLTVPSQPAFHHGIRTGSTNNVIQTRALGCIGGRRGDRADDHISVVLQTFTLSVAPP